MPDIAFFVWYTCVYNKKKRDQINFYLWSLLEVLSGSYEANAEPSKEQRILTITKETPSHKTQEKPIKA